MELSKLTTIALAAYRLAKMIAEEEGPFSVFLRLRILCGAYDYNEHGVPETSLGRGISCPLCVGMYASLLFLLLGQRWPVRLFAVAGGQTLLHLLFSGVSNGNHE